MLKQANIKISKKVRQNYNLIERKLGKQKVEFKLDFEHISNFMYEIKDSNKKGYKEIKIKGGHLAGSTKELEKVGLIVIKEEKMLRYGCKRFVAEDVLTGQKIIKTEFPSHWDLDKIMQKIFEAYDSLGDIDLLPGVDRLRRTGKTKEGLEILLVLDICDKDVIKLVTAIPEL